ncbi:TonB-dependent receptor [Limibacter armeniacum]|uniref:TonB-dependent receptor n=1 Tax=Limibacter armeniacum TaxID=466084 RepID=UPI002FE65FEA
MKQIIVIFLLLICLQPLLAQTGIIKGRVYDKTSNESVPLANVLIQGTSSGVTSDLDGNYKLEGLKPGLYNVIVSYVGYEPLTLFEIEVTNARQAIADFGLVPTASELEEVEVVAEGFYKSEESPVSVRTIGLAEVKRNPGGNRDISKVIRSLPGVASTASFRNDILIRGGAPNENRFYLDGIEVPNINHFATQGASGGPVGMINVDFIRDVEFYSGAFPAARGNALSSVMEFKQKDGRNDKLTANLILGASDVGATLEGPLTPKSSFIFSARRSYLQFLFKALGLPFLPTYNDFQLKYKYKFDQKNQLSIIGLGAIDDFAINDDPGSPDDEDYERNLYILDNIPIQKQWNYTFGAKYEHFRDNSTITLVASRNMLNNDQFKYPGNDESMPKLFDYESQEIENKFRAEVLTYLPADMVLTYGAGYEFAKYNNRSQEPRFVPGTGITDFNVSSLLEMHKWGVFANISKKFFDQRLTLSAGFRTDANDYSESMNNLAEQFSPRFSASYDLTKRFSLNFNTGIYYQLPTYTTLGYRPEGSEDFPNKQNELTYIRNRHIVGGVAYTVNERNFKISLEGFHKKYSNYPFSVTNQIALANLGADFGVIGNEEVTSTAEGRAYGLEFLAQQKFYRGFYGILAYTFVKSEFTDNTGEFVPSSWDSRHLVSLTMGKKLGRNWEIGGRWLFSGGTPYTPYDVEASMQKEQWDQRNQGVLDYTQLNTERTANFHQLDVRVDKNFYFSKWSLNLYFDIQNLYSYEVEQQPILSVERDANGTPIVANPDAPVSEQQYIPKFIENTSGQLLPTLGVIVEL